MAYTDQTLTLSTGSKIKTRQDSCDTAHVQKIVVYDADGDVLLVTPAGGSVACLPVANQTIQMVTGSVAVDVADQDPPVKTGMVAVAFGANPSSVGAAGRIQNQVGTRAGQAFVLGGHPNIVSRIVSIADADGAQTNASLVGTISAGTKVILTSCWVRAGTLTSPIAVRIGFGTSAVPTATLAGVNGMVLDIPGLASNQAHGKGDGAGVIGVGADDQELRITCGDPATGGITVELTYFTIES